MYGNVWQQCKDASGRKLNEASSSFCAQQASANIWTGTQLGFVHPKCEKCPFLLLLRLAMGTFPDDIILSRTLPYCPPQPHIEVLLLQRAISISGWLAAPTACHRIKAYHSSNLHLTSPSLHSPYKYLPFLPSSPSSLSSSSPLPHLLPHSNFQQSHFIQLGHLSDVQSHFETMFAAENIGWRSIWSHWDAHSIREIWDNFFRSTAHFIPR